jgi:hypothetical protein
MELEGYICGPTRDRTLVMRIETRGVWFVHQSHAYPDKYVVTHAPSGALTAWFDGGERGMRKALSFMRALPECVGEGIAWGGVGITAGVYAEMQRAFKAACAVELPDPLDAAGGASVRDELRRASRGLQ